LLLDDREDVGAELELMLPPPPLLREFAAAVVAVVGGEEGVGMGKVCAGRELLSGWSR
jgi:hypothetical protein